MEEIIKPMNKELPKAELTEDRRLRMTNKNNSQICTIIHQSAPNVICEIGRLRKITFHAAGEGTGLSMDIDECGTMEHPYKQLIVWNPKAEEILSGYRYLLGADVRSSEAGAPILATSHIFHSSDVFVKKYLPQTIGLGCSFVTLEYQSTHASSKGLFALDNLWGGLGAPTVAMPNVKYFSDKVTTYPSYHRRGRNMTLYFFKKHFSDREGLVTPTEPLILETSDEELRTLLCKDIFKEDYKILSTETRKPDYSIPPLVNAYMSLSPTTRMFGTAINCEFGDVEETGILVAVGEVLEDKRIRYIQTFIEGRPDAPKMSCESGGVLTSRVVTLQENYCR